ncbi:MAG: flagellar biosynthetic protein FliP [Clostridia bacterium]|nr:flagellar biosynthetic protein FliP [Clostridia bacterium]
MLMLIVCLVSFSAAAETDDSIATEVSGLSEIIGGSNTLDIILSMSLIMLIPSILIMTTCFTRIIIVLSILRNALGLQQTPPNQVLIGIALFLSLFIMAPVIGDINTQAYEPYKNGEISQGEVLEKAVVPLREFMMKQTKNEDLNFFLEISGSERPETYDEISTFVIIPAFITSELRRAFLIGFLMYLPFLIIDMVVASTLMSMGMVMLPPTIISLPFKLMLFVLVDGWKLLFQTLVSSFN